MVFRHIPNADEDPDYIGHRIIEGADFSYSLPIFSDPTKNVKTDKVISDEKRPVVVDVLVEKKDMVEGKNPKDIIKERKK